MRNLCWFILLIGLSIYEVSSSNNQQPCPDGTKKLVIGKSRHNYRLFCKYRVKKPDHYRCEHISPIDDYICDANTKCDSRLKSYLSSNAFFHVCKKFRRPSASFEKDEIANGLIKPLKFICLKPNKLEGKYIERYRIGSSCRLIGPGWKHSKTYISEDCYDVSMHYEICYKGGTKCYPRLRFLCKSSGRDDQDNIPDGYVICIADKKPSPSCGNVVKRKLKYKCGNSKRNTEGCVKIDKRTQKVYSTESTHFGRAGGEHRPLPLFIKSEDDEKKEGNIYFCSEKAADDSCVRSRSSLKFICSTCDNGGNIVKFDKDDSNNRQYVPFVCKKMVQKRQCTRVTEFDEFHCGREEKVCTRGISRVASLIQRKNMRYFCYLDAKTMRDDACEKINKEDIPRNMHLIHLQVCESPEPTNIENVAEDCTPVSPGLIYKRKNSKNCIKIKKGFLCDVTGCLTDVKYLCDAAANVWRLKIESQETTPTMKICKKIKSTK